MVQWRFELWDLSMKKLPDSELAERVRTRNTRRTLAYRERLTQSGKTQLAIWIPIELRNQVDAAAELNGRTLSAETAALIQDGFEWRELAK